MRTACVLLTLLALGLVACGEDASGKRAPGSPAPRLPDVVVTARHDGGSTALKVGQVLRVALEVNPSSGYAWTLEEVRGAALRAPEMEEYVPPASDGAPGLSVWRFTAREAGTSTVRLRHARIGDDVPGGESVFTFTAVVD